MQSRMLFMFSIYLLRQVLPRLQGDAHKSGTGLLKSGMCLKEWYGIIRRSEHVVPPEDCRRAVVLAKKHTTLWAAHSGQSAKPKHHALVDMSRAMARFGNPNKFSTYNDESFNSLIARLARSVHPAHFALSVLKKYWLRRSLKRKAF